MRSSAARTYVVVPMLPPFGYVFQHKCAFIVAERLGMPGEAIQSEAQFEIIVGPGNRLDGLADDLGVGRGWSHLSKALKDLWAGDCSGVEWCKDRVSGLANVPFSGEH